MGNFPWEVPVFRHLLVNSGPLRPLPVAEASAIVGHRPTSSHRPRSATVALVATASLLVSAPSEADTEPFVLDIDALPQGEARHLPYVDGQAQKIVDGTRQVDVHGLLGTVIQLHKVDGG